MPLATRRAKRALLALGLRPSACKPSRPVSGQGQGRQPPKAGARSASLEPGRAPVYSAQLLSPQAGRGESDSCADSTQCHQALARQITLIAPGDGLIRSDDGIEGIEVLRAADAAQRKPAGGDQIAAPGCVQAGAKIRRSQEFAIDRTAH